MAIKRNFTFIWIVKPIEQPKDCGFSLILSPMSNTASYPPPLVPTMATFFPAGTVKLAPESTTFSVSYLKHTFSKTISPFIESKVFGPSY
jgi:hypothetical protein